MPQDPYCSWTQQETEQLTHDWWIWAVDDLPARFPRFSTVQIRNKARSKGMYLSAATELLRQAQKAERQYEKLENRKARWDRHFQAHKDRINARRRAAYAAMTEEEKEAYIAKGNARRKAARKEVVKAPKKPKAPRGRPRKDPKDKAPAWSYKELTPEQRQRFRDQQREKYRQKTGYYERKPFTAADGSPQVRKVARQKAAEKRREVEAQWAAQALRNEAKREKETLATRQQDLSRPLRIDRRTTIYLKPGQTEKQAREHYENLRLLRERKRTA